MYFSIIKILCYLNITFVIQHAVSFIFMKRLKRFYTFPTVIQLSDITLCFVSVYYIQWHHTVINQNLDDLTLSEQEKKYRLMDNMQQAV